MLHQEDESVCFKERQPAGPLNFIGQVFSSVGIRTLSLPNFEELAPALVRRISELPGGNF
jgi:hypothetical protein